MHGAREGTGETTEVDREIMKALRNEEKKLRRSYDTGGASESEDSEDAQLPLCCRWTLCRKMM